jgi:hypothetical protein
MVLTNFISLELMASLLSSSSMITGFANNQEYSQPLILSQEHLTPQDNTEFQAYPDGRQVKREYEYDVVVTRKNRFKNIVPLKELYYPVGIFDPVVYTFSHTNQITTSINISASITYSLTTKLSACVGLFDIVNIKGEIDSQISTSLSAAFTYTKTNINSLTFTVDTTNSTTGPSMYGIYNFILCAYNTYEIQYDIKAHQYVTTYMNGIPGGRNLNPYYHNDKTFSYTIPTVGSATDVQLGIQLVHTATWGDYYQMLQGYHLLED